MSTTFGTKNPHNLFPIRLTNRLMIHIGVKLMRTKWVIFKTKQYRTFVEASLFNTKSVNDVVLVLIFSPF